MFGEKVTKYYQFNDKPVIVEYKKYPVMYTGKKKKVMYELFDFMVEATEISKQKFEEMKANEGF